MADPPRSAEDGVVKPSGEKEVKESGATAPAAPASEVGAVVDSGPTPAPKGKPGGLRKRKRGEQSAGSDDEDEGGVNLAALRELREEQKLRTQREGVTMSTLGAAAGPPAKRRLIALTAGGAAAGAGGADTLYGSQGGVLGSGFTTSSSGNDSAESDAMKAFIEAKMAEITGKGSTGAAAGGGGGSGAAARPPAAGGAGTGSAPGASGAASTAAGASADDDRWLYELPEALVPVAPKERRDADMGEGGMMLGGTGIVEVALPVDFKLRNIEVTEQARMDMLQRRAAARGGAAAGGGGGEEGPALKYAVGSITSNFNLHRREFAMKMQGRSALPDDTPRSSAFSTSDARTSALTAIGSVGTGEGGGARAGGGDRGDRVNFKRVVANDDAVFQRFRKAEINRKR